MRQETAPSFVRTGLLPARARRGARLCRAAAAALALLFVAHPAPSEEARVEVEARFVLQLIRYVTWPESALPKASPLVVGVLGDDGFAATLRGLVGDRRAPDRVVEVRVIPDTAGASPDVHLLFVRGGDPAVLRDLARAHYSAPVLTVADRFDFPKLGGDIGIERVSDRVSFSINRRKSVRGDLEISSKLLRLASEVK